PSFFFPQAQVGRTNLVLLVRASGNVKRLEKPIREIINRLDPTQPLFDVRPMAERVAETWATHRLLTFLLTIFAGLALLLAAVGLYGVLAYSALRTRWESPACSIIAIATLALGIGANTAIFSVIESALLRPLPFPKADRLVRVYETFDENGARSNTLNLAEKTVRQWREYGSDIFEGIGA